MKRIQLWMIEDSVDGPRVGRIDELTDTETEQKLETLLVASPDLLLDGLTVVARQLQTEGGPLDLIGVDAEGRLVVFELKRGELTRDAVAQVVDYASDLAERKVEDIARLIEEYSGHSGVQKISGAAAVGGIRRAGSNRRVGSCCRPHGRLTSGSTRDAPYPSPAPPS